MKNVTKVQREALVKAFKLLRIGAEMGEKLSRETGADPEVLVQLLEHVTATVRISKEIETALQMHIGAASLLETISTRRAKEPSKAPVGRPRTKLRLLPGGGS